VAGCAGIVSRSGAHEHRPLTGRCLWSLARYTAVVQPRHGGRSSKRTRPPPTDWTAAELGRRHPEPGAVIPSFARDLCRMTTVGGHTT
jgi:hypothetical protein